MAFCLQLLRAQCDSFRSFFRARLDPIDILQHQGNYPSDRLINIGVKSASERLFDSFYPVRSASSRYAPKADKNQSIGDLKFNRMRRSTDAHYRPRLDCGEQNPGGLVLVDVPLSPREEFARITNPRRSLWQPTSAR